MKFNNAVFVVTETSFCPLYTVGEEFAMQDSALTVERDKQICLILMHELLRVLADTTLPQKAKFECGGCSGLIRFERKKDKACSALQMNLLKAAEQRANQRLTSETFSILRAMELFAPLSDIDLQALALLMKLRRWPPDKMIIAEGERGRSCFIVLSGHAAVTRKDSKVVAEIGPGGVFGEMSLLTGELTYPSVYSRIAVHLAVLNAKDFKRILVSHPVLQIFFYRLLISRVKENAMQSGRISSGMSGELTDISLLSLF